MGSCKENLGRITLGGKSVKDKLVKHIETLFQPYEKTEELLEFKSEILLNLTDRYNDYLEEGLSQEDAFDKTIQSIGDMAQLISENQGDVEAASRTLLINFSASNLKEGDFRNESIVGGAFNASNLKGANFSNTKIEDSNFNSSDLNGVVFNHVKMLALNLPMLEMFSLIVPLWTRLYSMPQA